MKRININLECISKNGLLDDIYTLYSFFKDKKYEIHKISLTCLNSLILNIFEDSVYKFIQENYESLSDRGVRFSIFIPLGLYNFNIRPEYGEKFSLTYIINNGSESDIEDLLKANKELINIKSSEERGLRKLNFRYNLDESIDLIINKINLIKSYSNQLIVLKPEKKEIKIDDILKFQKLKEVYLKDEKIVLNDIDTIQNFNIFATIDNNYLYLNNCKIDDISNIKSELCEEYIINTIYDKNKFKNDFFPNGFLNFYNNLLPYQKFQINNYLNTEIKEKSFKGQTIKDYYKIEEQKKEYEI